MIDTVCFTLWTGGTNAVWNRHALHFWGLSVSQAARWFPHVRLIADAAGQAVLSDRLALPFTEIIDLPAIPPRLNFLPMVGKLYGLAASVRRGVPFLNLDYDLFLWRKPLPEVLRAAAIAQCQMSVSAEVARLTAQLPAPVPRWSHACNAGATGASDLATMDAYLRMALALAEDRRNDPALRSVPAWAACSTLDEALFCAFFRERMAFLMEPLAGDAGDAARFERGGLTHLAGGEKGDALNCFRAETRLGMLYPELYERVQRTWFDTLAAEARDSGSPPCKPGSGCC